MVNRVDSSFSNMISHTLSFEEIDHSPPTKKQRIANRCFGCQRKGHMIKDCPNKIRCYNCQQFHHFKECPLGKVGEQPRPFAKLPTALEKGKGVMKE